MRQRAISLVLSLILGAIACGGSGSDGGTTGPTTTTTNGTFTAQVNGTNWSAAGPASVSKSASNFLVVAGVGPIGSVTYSLGFAVGTATGPGTYSLSFQNPSASVLTVVTAAGGAWSSALSGGTGTLTITTLTANHIVATFSANLVPTTGGGAATVVSNGKMDLTF